MQPQINNYIKILSYLEKYSKSQLRAFQDFYDTLPNYVYANSCKIHPQMLPQNKIHKSEAIGFPYIRVNSNGYIKYLIFDNDTTDIYLFRNSGLPKPSFIVINLQNGHSHYYYALEVWVHETQKEAFGYCRDICYGMGNQLNCHTTPTAGMSKNPFQINFHNSIVTNQTYSLNELNKFIDPCEKRRTFKGTRGKRSDQNSLINIEDIEKGNRNNSFFLNARLTILQKLRERSLHKHDIYDECLDILIDYNNQIEGNGVEPLSMNELKGIARNIHNYWQTHEVTDSKNRNIMSIEGLIAPTDNLSTKQQKGAEYTAEQKRKKTANKIEQAVQKLLHENKKITQEAISKESGLSLSTIKRYKHILKIQKCK